MKGWIPTLIAAVLALIFAVPAIRHWRERPPVPPLPPAPVRSAWMAPAGVDAGGGGDYVFGLALARDGRKLVYPASSSGTVTLRLADLRTGEVSSLPGTDGGVAPSWSPDERRIAFFAGGRLKAIDLESRQVSDLAAAPSGRGAAWNAAGDLIYAPAATGALLHRRADGSTAPFTTLAPGEASHAWPSWLDDGRQVVFLVSGSDRSRTGIWTAPFDKPSERRRILDTDTQALLVGRTLVSLADRSLVAQSFDADTQVLDNRARIVGAPAGRGPIGQLLATASSDVLIYTAASETLRQLRWLGRAGQEAGPASEPIDAWDLRIAPDGRRIVVTEVDRQLRTLDVFIRTSAQPAPMRLSLSTDADDSGVWSPDGLRVAWAGQRRKVMIRGAGAVLPEQTIATFDEPVQVWDWSRDGRTLVIGRKSTSTGDDIWLQPPQEGAGATPYFAGAFNQVYASLAPDGGRIAYASDESGQFDVYIDSFPKPGSRVRVSTAGGTEPRWRADGRELFFRRGSEIHAVALDRFEVRSIARLFDAGAPIRAFDVGRDGRFLVNVPAARASAPAATFITNWTSSTR